MLKKATRLTERENLGYYLIPNAARREELGPGAPPKQLVNSSFKFKQSQLIFRQTQARE